MRQPTQAAKGAAAGSLLWEARARHASLRPLDCFAIATIAPLSQAPESHAAHKITALCRRLAAHAHSEPRRAGAAVTAAPPVRAATAAQSCGRAGGNSTPPPCTPSPACPHRPRQQFLAAQACRRRRACQARSLPRLTTACTCCGTRHRESPQRRVTGHSQNLLTIVGQDQASHSSLAKQGYLSPATLACFAPDDPAAGLPCTTHQTPTTNLQCHEACPAAARMHRRL